MVCLCHKNTINLLNLTPFKRNRNVLRSDYLVYFRFAIYFWPHYCVRVEHVFEVYYDKKCLRTEILLTTVYINKTYLQQKTHQIVIKLGAYAFKTRGRENTFFCAVVNKDIPLVHHNAYLNYKKPPQYQRQNTVFSTLPFYRLISYIFCISPR